ncbi:MAG: 50S ribosomal protein L13 [Candidatus Omnitrophica bacterium]|nr:50S ribosomal protein L13 [Candidatus Omnitrophota bacterium]
MAEKRANRTYMAKKEEIIHKYYLIDAKDKILGRVAAKAAALLRGKHKTQYTPNIDTGDYVVIINAAKIRVTGKKLTDKVYDHYTGFHSGLKVTSLGEMLSRRPEKVMELAVSRMIPKGPLGYRTVKKLKIFAGDKHPHAAQKPETIEI